MEGDWCDVERGEEERVNEELLDRIRSEKDLENTRYVAVENDGEVVGKLLKAQTDIRKHTSC